jgi:glycosyltransferase involved in cell wall biosynthesis
MHISLVVTTYNNAESISRCLNSVKSFIKKLRKINLKIILVDDASVDNTPAILLKYSKEMPSTEFKKFKTNKGVSRSRNYGISKSLDMDYLLFLDGDDELNTELADFLNKNKLENDFYTFDFSKVDNEKEIQYNHLENRRVFNDNSISEYLLDYLVMPNKKSMFISCWAKLYKTKVLKNKVKLRFKEGMKINEDIYFVISFMRECKVIEYINVPSYKYSDYSELTKRASLAITSDVIKFFSIISALRQLKLYLIEKQQNINDVNLKFYHCIGAYTCIYSIRAFIRVKSLSDFVNVSYQMKKIYKKTIIEKSLKIYDVDKANGSKVMSFFLKRKYFFVASILIFINSRKRYK